MPPKTPKTAGLSIEASLWADGYRVIVGFDEAGRGAWAGPVAAGAVLLPLDHPDLLTLLAGVRDSKQLSARQRQLLAEDIRTVALHWGVGNATNSEIDALGIVPATRLAMQRALEQMPIQPDCLLLDAISWPEMQPRADTYSVVHGDQLSLTMAAASILAKTWRDQYMTSLDAIYPQYHFSQHKGYGTASHSAALDAHGVLPIHRHTFAPIKRRLSGRNA